MVQPAGVVPHIPGMQTQRLIARLSALLPELKAEGNHDLAARVESVIADLERKGRGTEPHQPPPTRPLQS
jgi:hypothetical protein